MRPFVDTNVLVYAHDRDEPAKRAAALDILAEHAGAFVVSSQVLAEFSVTVTRKLSRPLAVEEAAAQVGALAQGIVVGADADMVLSAVPASRDHGLSLWDAMIVGAAARGGCDVLLTEDLQDGAVIHGVRIRDPFAGISHPGP